MENKEQEKEIDIFSISNINREENNITLKNALLIGLFYILGNVVGVTLITYLLKDINMSTIKLLGYANLFGSIFAGLFFAIYLNKSKITIFKREKTKTALWVKIVLIPIYTMLTMILPSFLLNIYNNTNNSGEVVAQNQEILKTMSDKSNPIVIFLMIVILAPFLEEILFRAIPLFYHSNKHKWINSNIAMWIRIIIFSLIFGSLHNPSNIVEWLAYSSASIPLQASVLLTNRIETSIGIHMFNNFIGFLFLI